MTGTLNGCSTFMEVEVSMQQSELVGAMEEAPDLLTPQIKSRALGHQSFCLDAVINSIIALIVCMTNIF